MSWGSRSSEKLDGSAHLRETPAHRVNNKSSACTETKDSEIWIDEIRATMVDINFNKNIQVQSNTSVSYNYNTLLDIFYR